MLSPASEDIGRTPIVQLPTLVQIIRTAILLTYILLNFAGSHTPGTLEKGCSMKFQKGGGLPTKNMLVCIVTHLGTWNMSNIFDLPCPIQLLKELLQKFALCVFVL